MRCRADTVTDAVTHSGTHTKSVAGTDAVANAVANAGADAESDVRSDSRPDAFADTESYFRSDSRSDAFATNPGAADTRRSYAVSDACTYAATDLRCRFGSCRRAYQAHGLLGSNIYGRRATGVPPYRCCRGRHNR